MGWNECPRCGMNSLEHLATHSHCWECGYSPEYELEAAAWREMEFHRCKPGSSTQAALPHIHFTHTMWPLL